MKAILLLMLYLVPTPDVPCGGSKSMQSASHEIIWRDFSKHPDSPDPEATKEAEFIPEAILNAKPVEELPLSESSRNQLRAYLERGSTPAYNYFGRRVTPCGFRSSGVSMRGNPAGRPLREVLAEKSLVFTAEIIAVIPGWGNSRVMTLFLVKPRNVLRDVNHCLEAERMYSGTLLGGEIQVRGQYACFEKNPDFYWPGIGDEVLFTGYCSPIFPEGYLAFSLWAKVEGGFVLVQPWSQVNSPDRVALDDLR